MYFDQDTVFDRAERATIIVVLAPSLQLLAGIRKRHEPVSVQTSASELAIERLNDIFVRRLAKP